MSVVTSSKLTGGCLCGALRYEINGQLLYTGLCHCPDCQKSTGSAFAPYMGVSAENIVVTGPFTVYNHSIEGGRVSRRNFCPSCGSTVFGGDPLSGTLTVYAGTLDDSSLFIPRNQIFTRVRRTWAHVPPGQLPEFERLP